MPIGQFRVKAIWVMRCQAFVSKQNNRMMAKHLDFISEQEILKQLPHYEKVFIALDHHETDLLAY